MSEVVKLERQDDVAIVTVDSPPVNALSAAFSRGINDQIKAAASADKVKAIVLTCAGRTFIAGADRSLPIDDLVNALLESPIGRRDWPLRFWSRARLMSVEARRGWVEPDLAPWPQARAVRM